MELWRNLLDNLVSGNPSTKVLDGWKCIQTWRAQEVMANVRDEGRRWLYRRRLGRVDGREAETIVAGGRLYSCRRHE